MGRAVRDNGDRNRFRPDPFDIELCQRHCRAHGRFYRRADGGSRRSHPRGDHGGRPRGAASPGLALGITGAIGVADISLAPIGLKRLIASLGIYDAWRWEAALVAIIVIPLVLQQIAILGRQGLDPLEAATNFLPRTIPTILAIVLAGSPIDRINPKWLIPFSKTTLAGALRPARGVASNI